MGPKGLSYAGLIQNRLGGSAPQNWPTCAW